MVVIQSSPSAAALPAADGPTREKHVLGEIAGELRWTFAERKGWLVGVGFNLVIAAIYVGYTHYQPRLRDSVRVTGIATGVAAWVLADVINTNQLGDDADRVAASLEDGHGVMRELALKNSALTLLLLPLTVLISVAVRLVLDRWRAIPHAVLLDLFVVFMWLGVGNLVSVLLPYRPIALKERCKARRSWLRWGVCLGAPYLMLFSINYLRWPVDRFCHHVLGRPDKHLLAYAFSYFCWGVVVWAMGLALAGLYGKVAKRRLVADLRRTT